MLEWPSTLPWSALIDGYGETDDDPRIITPMDSGPVKVRPRYTSVSSYTTEQYWLTEKQYEDLMKFYRTDTMYGSLMFTKRHPRTGVVRTCRFSPESTEPVSLQRSTGEDYLVQVNIEVLP